MIQLLLRFPYLVADAEDHNTHTAEGRLLLLLLLLLLMMLMMMMLLLMMMLMTTTMMKMSMRCFHSSSTATPPSPPYAFSSGILSCVRLHGVVSMPYKEVRASSPRRAPTVLM